MARDIHAASIAHLSRDERLGAFIKSYGPLKHRRYHARSAFESLARSIIYQQLSGKAADTICGRFVSLWPNKKFPTAKDLLQMRASSLRKAGLSQQKASYLKDLAAKFEDETINPQLFSRMSDEEIIEHVTAVKGIGEWTAQMFLMFTLGRPDVLPTGDLGIQKAFQKVFNLRTKPSPIQMEKLSRVWSGHRTVACFYLWRMLDAQ
jgi:DNA-3-methyladenine glycosylase II